MYFEWCMRDCIIGWTLYKTLSKFWQVEQSFLISCSSYWLRFEYQLIRFSGGCGVVDCLHKDINIPVITDSRINNLYTNTPSMSAAAKPQSFYVMKWKIFFKSHLQMPNDMLPHLCALIMNSSVKPTIRLGEIFSYQFLPSGFCGWRSKRNEFSVESFSWNSLERMLENA